MPFPTCVVACAPEPGRQLRSQGAEQGRARDMSALRHVPSSAVQDIGRAGCALSVASCLHRQ